MTVNQMITEMTRHYVSQGIRQMYVLVLGLDVLGNPFGVLRGMAQGVEDLFYEPVKVSWLFSDIFLPLKFTQKIFEIGRRCVK